MDNISLKCFTCKTSSTDGLYPRFQYFCKAYGYGNITWSNSTDSIPERDKDNRWDDWGVTLPNINELRAINVSYPFTSKVSDLFWCHFITPEISQSDNCAENYVSTVFLQCEVVKYLEITEFTAWVIVKVVKKISIDDALNILPEVPEDGFMRNFYLFENSRIEFYGNWIFICGDAQSDLSEWILIYNSNDICNAIAFGTYSYHNDWSFLTNVKISEESMFRLLAACE